jgi:hypothetical protein
MRRVRVSEVHDYDLVAGIIDEPESGYCLPSPPLFPILHGPGSMPISRGQ